MVLDLANLVNCLKANKAELTNIEGNKIWCKFDHHKITASELISELAKELSIVDLSVKDPDIEDDISRFIMEKDEFIFLF